MPAPGRGVRAPWPGTGAEVVRAWTRLPVHDRLPPDYPERSPPAGRAAATDGDAEEALARGTGPAPGRAGAARPVPGSRPRPAGRPARSHRSGPVGPGRGAAPRRTGRTRRRSLPGRHPPGAWPGHRCRPCRLRRLGRSPRSARWRPVPPGGGPPGSCHRGDRGTAPPPEEEQHRPCGEQGDREPGPGHPQLVSADAAAAAGAPAWYPCGRSPRPRRARRRRRRAAWRWRGCDWPGSARGTARAPW